MSLMFHIYFTLKAFANFQVVVKKLSQKQQLREAKKLSWESSNFTGLKGQKLKSRAHQQLRESPSFSLGLPKSFSLEGGM